MLNPLTNTIPNHASNDPIGKLILLLSSSCVSSDKQKAIHIPTIKGPTAFERPAPMLPNAFVLLLISAGTVLFVATVMDEKKADWNTFVTPDKMDRYSIDQRLLSAV